MESLLDCVRYGVSRQARLRLALTKLIPAS